MTGVDVVLFDLDDTLLDHRGAVAAAIVAHRRAVLPASGATDAEELSRWLALEEHHYHRYLGGELDFLGQRRARARDFVAPYALTLDTDDEADRWWAEYAARYTAGWRLHDDVLPCLTALDDRRIGIVTNGELDAQSRKLDHLRLPGIEHVVASGELGVTKPDPRIFAHACALFGVPPARAAYIGDRLHTDAVGAAAAGLRGVWIDRPGTATSAERAAAAAAGAHVIRSLAELPPLLA